MKGRTEAMYVPRAGGKSHMTDRTETVFVPRAGGKSHIKGRIGCVCTQGKR